MEEGLAKASGRVKDPHSCGQKIFDFLLVLDALKEPKIMDPAPFRAHYP